MAFKSRLKCLFLKPIFCILFATFLHFARNTTMSANAFVEDIMNSKVAGMNMHLAKPLDETKLIETLKQCKKDERVN